MILRMDDLTGQRFGNLTVIKLSENLTKQGRKLWLCKCDCGNYREVLGSKLKSGVAKTCGCSRKKKLFVEDYIGEKINKWIILSLDCKKGNKEFALAKCDCGNICSVNFYNLYTGKSKDCGCGRKESLSIVSVGESLVGMKFGKLTVIEEAGRNKYKKVLYKCQCDCGNIKIAPASSLKIGTTLSCGCLQSKHNLELERVVLELGYNCVREKNNLFRK